MDWVKLFTHYDADVAIAAADDAAEVMFTRALAYAGRNRTGGFIPAGQLHHLTRHPTRAKKIVAQLTAPSPVGGPGPFEVVDGGWQIRNWEIYQDQLEGIWEYVWPAGEPDVGAENGVTSLTHPRAKRVAAPVPLVVT